MILNLCSLFTAWTDITERYLVRLNRSPNLTQCRVPRKKGLNRAALGGGVEAAHVNSHCLSFALQVSDKKCNLVQRIS